MSLPSPSYVVFKYDHPDPHVPWWVTALFWLGLIVALITAYNVFEEPGIITVVVLAVVVSLKWPKKQIYLGLRYLVCGRTVAYYRNVKKMVLRPGALTLYWGDKQSWTLEETRFPTNARKDHKIKANKQAKFKKVSEKIIRHVLAEAPGIELSGIDRDKHTKAAA